MFGLIVNPKSGGGKHETLVRKIENVLSQRGETVSLFETQCPGDGENQTRRAIAAGCTSVVCVGGDGSLSEVVSALAGSGVTLYVVPGGTGNDFARTLRLPKDPMQAFLAQLGGTPEQIDCGAVNGMPFINISGAGFDVEVLRRTEELKAVYPGGEAYRRAVLSVLSRYDALQTEVSIDGGAFESGRFTIVEVANGRYFGGGMCVAPGARVDDGLFDVVQVRRVPAKAIPLLLPLFIGGLHVHLPIAKVCRARSVTIRRQGMVVNIDGRLESMDEARFEILPGALRVMRTGKSAR